MAKESDVEKLYRQSAYIVNTLLYENTLSDTQMSFLKEYVDNYFDLLDKHLNGEDDKDALDKLQLYEMVLNEIDKNYEDLKSNDLPAFKYIDEKRNSYNMSIENKFAMVRKLEPPKNGGFATILLVLGSTIVAGIALGTLLWFIR